MANVLGSNSFLDTPDVNGNLVLTSATGVGSITGTSNQISVGGTLAAQTIGFAFNAVMPGSVSLTIPSGTTAVRPASPSAAMIRFNTTLGAFEQYAGSYWAPPGKVIQVVSGTIPSATASTATIALDNTVPLITAGWQLWTQSFTPLSTTSTVRIQFTATLFCNTAAATIIYSVFSGNTNVGSYAIRNDTANAALNATAYSSFVPGSTSAITISARVGSTAGTTGANNVNGATLGGALVTKFYITEFQ